MFKNGVNFCMQKNNRMEKYGILSLVQVEGVLSKKIITIKRSGKSW